MVIFDIGKGSGERMYEHVRRAKQNIPDSNNFTKLAGIKEIFNSGFDDVEYFKLFETFDEQEAYNREIELIHQYQTLYPNGWNLTRGGDCPPKMTGKNHPFFGKVGAFAGRRHSPETLEKMSKARLGTKRPHRGHVISEEQKQKISISRKTASVTLETRQKMSNAHKKRWTMIKEKQND